jgi:hypothetical protein
MKIIEQSHKIISLPDNLLQKTMAMWLNTLKTLNQVSKEDK